MRSHHPRGPTVSTSETGVEIAAGVSGVVGLVVAGPLGALLGAALTPTVASELG